MTVCMLLYTAISRINRNIVECKLTIQGLRVYLAEKVLIETLWNVNN